MAYASFRDEVPSLEDRRKAGIPDGVRVGSLPSNSSRNPSPLVILVRNGEPEPCWDGMPTDAVYSYVD